MKMLSYYYLLIIIREYRSMMKTMHDRHNVRANIFSTKYKFDRMPMIFRMVTRDDRNLRMYHRLSMLNNKELIVKGQIDWEYTREVNE